MTQQEPKTLNTWSAKRSGAAINLTGYLPSGDRITVAVARIEADTPYPIATTKDGHAYRLA